MRRKLPVRVRAAVLPSCSFISRVAAGEVCGINMWSLKSRSFRGRPLVCAWLRDRDTEVFWAHVHRTEEGNDRSCYRGCAYECFCPQRRDSRRHGRKLHLFSAGLLRSACTLTMGERRGRSRWHLVFSLAWYNEAVATVARYPSKKLRGGKRSVAFRFAEGKKESRSKRCGSTKKSTEGPWKSGWSKPR